MVGGNHAVAPPAVEVMELNAESLQQQQEHAAMLLDLEVKKMAASPELLKEVPTLPQDVRTALRNLGQPVRCFGETLADVRKRLTLSMARQSILNKGTIIASTTAPVTGDASTTAPTTTQYTHAPPELIEAREFIAQTSLKRSRARLEQERQLRASAKRLVDPTTGQCMSIEARSATHTNEVVLSTNVACQTLYKSVRHMALEGSQYGDGRPLSAIASDDSELIVTGGWSGSVKVWDAAGLNLLGTAVHAHEDRIMGIALHRHQPHNVPNETETAPYLMATASIDLTAKLWTVKYNSNSSEEEEGEKAEIVEMAHWKGHAARLAKVAIHPTGRYVGTTSFDTTWRLWDVERGGEHETELLLQDGHDTAVFGIDFHPDGSLCATSDFGGVVRLWDLRTSKSIHVMTGTHAGRALCTQFAKPWGFQLATAGDDGTIQIWDLRKHGKQLASLPAHSRLVTQLQYCPNGETLLSSSFDGTAKVWSTRADYKLLNTFRGHEGKVLGVASLMNGGSIATCGYDKTLKLWQ